MVLRHVWFIACFAILPLSAHAQDAYVWANDPTADRYMPSSLYSFNPTGDIVISRKSAGQYTVVFRGLGQQGDPSPGLGGHVQVSAYGSADRCNVGNWGYQGENFTVNVDCFEAGSNRSKDSRFTLNVRNRPFEFVTMSMEIASEEFLTLQAALAELSVRVEALEAP